MKLETFLNLSDESKLKMLEGRCDTYDGAAFVYRDNIYYALFPLDRRRRFGGDKIYCVHVTCEDLNEIWRRLKSPSNFVVENKKIKCSFDVYQLILSYEEHKKHENERQDKLTELEKELYRLAEMLNQEWRDTMEKITR